MALDVFRWALTDFPLATTWLRVTPAHPTSTLRGAEDVIWTAVLPIPFDSLSTFLVDIAHCLGLSPTLHPHPLALRSKAEAFDREFQKVPLVLLASVLTGRWQSNDNYGPHSVSLELAPAAN